MSVTGPIPTTCRAAVFTGYGEPFQVEEVPVPRDLEPGAVLVRTTAATVCASDVHIWEGMAQSEKHFPTILGHEMIGEIVKFGAGVERDSIGQPLELGDRITWSHGFCGQCYFCVIENEPTLCPNRRGYMSTSIHDYPHLVGGFAEYCYIFPTSGRVKVPADISDHVASASSCAMRSTISAFDRLGEISDRHTVVIQGVGPVGLFSTAKALASGAKQVFAIGGPAARIEIAKTWGAIPLSLDEIPDPSARLAAVMDATDGRGADVVVEASGVPVAFAEGIDMLRRGGRYLIVGPVHDKDLPFNPSTIVHKQLTLIGNISASIKHYYRALEFIRRHSDRFSWEDILSNHYPLEKTTDALRNMRTWDEIKPVITMD